MMRLSRLVKHLPERKAAYVKTSTGYTEVGATLHHVKLMRKHAGPEVKVKTAGGVRHFEDAIAMLEHGAYSIGASRTEQILGSEVTED